MSGPSEINEIAKVCADCGNCLYSCPVYNAELTEPNSPRGKVNLIKGIMKGELSDSKRAKSYIYQCMLCGSCEDTCTKGVQYTDMMISYRNMMSKNSRIPLLKKLILLFYQSVLYRIGMPFLDLLAKTPLRKRFLIPRRMKDNLADLYSNTGRYDEEGNADILFFPGCVLRDFYPEIIRKSIEFLKKNGFTVLLPKDLTCCGFPYISQGWETRFKGYQSKNRSIFQRFQYRYIVVPCGTCMLALNKFYEIPVGVQVVELTDFIYHHIQDAKIQDQFKKDRKLTYHDPCHNLKSLDIQKQPRHFLKQADQNFVDDTSRSCCGFGGLFSVGFPATSAEILKKKKEFIKATGAETVVTSCPGCLMQLKENLPVEVKFFTEILS